MHEELETWLEKTGCTPKEFFRFAHLRQFNHDANTETDALTYKVGGIIPEYVKNYLIYLRSTR